VGISPRNAHATSSARSLQIRVHGSASLRVAKTAIPEDIRDAIENTLGIKEREPPPLRTLGQSVATSAASTQSQRYRAADHRDCRELMTSIPSSVRLQQDRVDRPAPKLPGIRGSSRASCIAMRRGRASGDHETDADNERPIPTIVGRRTAFHRAGREGAAASSA